MSDIISIGNALIDTFLLLPDDSVHCHVNRTDKLLSIDYGQKIMLHSCEFHLGGNAANVAVGLSRLGVSSALLAEIGKDEFAEKIVRILKEEGVDTSHVLHDDKPTSFGVNLQFEGERTIFVQHQKRSHDFPLSELKAPWIYLTSLGESWKHVYSGMVTYMKNHSETQLALNPGTKQFEEGAELIKELLPHTAVFIANKEEYIDLLYGKGQRRDSYTPVHLLSAVRTSGTKICVLTDGKEGSYILGGDTLYHMGIIESPIVGRTGAGDAFSTGFLASFMEEGDITQAMRMGTANAASVVGHIGAQTGLLKKHALSSWHERMESVPVTLKTL